MKLSRSLLAAVALTAATAAVGVFAYWRLPAGALIDVHFNAAGQATGAAPKGQALAIMPVVSGLVIGLLALMARFGPNRERLARSSVPFGVLLVCLAAVFFTAEASIAAKAMNPAFDLLRTVFLSVAVLLAVVGNFLGKLRQNHLFGVRTPWTLGDERVWDKTHRFTGWSMVLAGTLLAVIDLTAPAGRVLIAATAVCAAGPLLLGVAYSAGAWRREHRA